MNSNFQILAGEFPNRDCTGEQIDWTATAGLP